MPSRLLCLLTLTTLSCLSEPARADAGDEAARILSETGVAGGVVVHLGCHNGELTAALHASDAYVVHGLDSDKTHVAQARESLRQQGLYGTVSIDHWQGPSLPYIDNMVNLFVTDELGEVTMEEVLRVLVPHGVAYVKTDDSWTKTVKPRPQNIDDWTHYLHDPGNNAVAHDDVVGPPRHLQWHGSPRWSRHHDRMASMSALVSSNGRLVYVMDEGSRISIQTPSEWKLIARDAFNGTILWKRDMTDWQHHLWPLKSGPTQLARRLVAVGDRVYCTLSFESTLHVLDAVTGKTLMTLDDSQATEEILVDGNTIYALVNKGESELTNYLPANNTGDQARVDREWKWNEQPREIHAYDAESGAMQWSKETVCAPLTMSLDSHRVYFHDGEKVVALDRANGENVWSSQPAGRKEKVTINFGPRLVVYKDTVLFAGGDRKMTAYNAADGEQLWTSKHESSGYKSPEDLLVVGGLVWSWPTTSTRDTGELTGRDPRTGEVKSQFSPNVETYWFHHRCYIAKATDKYLMPSRTGIEFVDFAKEDWEIHHWVRGGCLYGVMPANGLTYAPPHNCACYPEAKLYGFNALAATSPSRKVRAIMGQADRLEKGDAWDLEALALNQDSTEPPVQQLADNSTSTTRNDDWPTFRHDARRSGSTSATLSAKLAEAWDSDLGGRLTSVVVSDGLLLVAQVDQHVVHALDTASGDVRWSFMTGGRVDSPPTIDRGRAYFGCADGYVYCVRMQDGKLVWRFRAAPEDKRLMSFEQLESVWPVHGSVLVQQGEVAFACGRSNFLDGGLRMIKLDAATGKLLSEKIIDDKDPETGENLQVRVKKLQMPVGLPDILSSDGNYVYMKSQKFDLDGNRLELGPHSENTVEQTMEQRGEGTHLFAPMGYLDDTWFHRAYWVYGKSFAGGHDGYYQAGRFAPSGRILVFDDEHVFGYGRKPEYLKWTTTIEHQLFSTSRTAPEVPNDIAKRRGQGSAKTILFDDADAIHVAKTGVTFEAWVNAKKPNGVIMARGGDVRGVALAIKGGKPSFRVREDKKVYKVTANKPILGRWVHLVGAVTGDGTLRLYLDGKLMQTAEGVVLNREPNDGLSLGSDGNSAVDEWGKSSAFTGSIDEVRVYLGDVTDEFVATRFAEADSSLSQETPAGVTLALAVNFDDGLATDTSVNGLTGDIQGASVTDGKVGKAMAFGGKAKAKPGGSFVEKDWVKDVPVYVRAMVKAGDTVFICGPPDLMNEEKTFEQIMAGEKAVQKQLADQDAALKGADGGLLLAVSTETGTTVASYDVDALPTWDGMAIAEGAIFLSTTAGRVICWRPEK